LHVVVPAAVSLLAAEPARLFNRPESLAELPRPKRLEVSKLLTLVITKVPAARSFSRDPRPGRSCCADFYKQTKSKAAMEREL
jgi:hypothetical protein